MMYIYIPFAPTMFPCVYIALQQKLAIKKIDLHSLHWRQFMTIEEICQKWGIEQTLQV